MNYNRKKSNYISETIGPYLYLFVFNKKKWGCKVYGSQDGWVLLFLSPLRGDGDTHCSEQVEKSELSRANGILGISGEKS